MIAKFYDRLSSNYTQLLENSDEYNVIINIGKVETQSFKAHSIILQYRCPYFYQQLKDISPNINNIKEINEPDITIKVFDIII
ncbi:21051_t:CDS:1, partial [Racocetra persica]